MLFITCAARHRRLYKSWRAMVYLSRGLQKERYNREPLEANRLNLEPEDRHIAAAQSLTEQDMQCYTHCSEDR